jgi:hypothetical protein
MHATVSIARLTAAALAVAATFAGTASAVPRAFTLDVDGGALSLGPAPLPIPSGVKVTGSVDDNGVVTVPAAGLTFPSITEPGMFAGTISAAGDGTGTFNDATGGMTLNLPLRIDIDDVPGGGDKFPDDCAIGATGAPVRLALKTFGDPVPLTPEGATLRGAPFKRETGTIALTDPAPQLPAADNCGGTLATFLALKWAIGLTGRLAIPAKAAPPAPINPGTPPTGGTPQPPAPALPPNTAPSTLEKLSRLVLTAPAKQRGVKAVLGVDVDQPAQAVLTASVKIAGVKKATKLAAVRRTLKTGRASVAVSFPSSLRRKAQRALRAGKRVVVTVTVTATDASGTRLTRSRQIRLTR